MAQMARYENSIMLILSESTLRADGEGHLNSTDEQSPSSRVHKIYLRQSRLVT